MKNVVVAFLLFSFTTLSAQKVSLEEVQNHMNSTVTVCGKVFNGVYLETVKNTPTLINMGGTFPNHQLTLLIWGENLKDFPPKPEIYYANRQVCVTGLVVEYRGKPEIVLKSPDQIQLQSETAGTTPRPTPKTPAPKAADNTPKTPAPKVADNTAKTTTSSSATQDDIKLSGDVKLRSIPSNSAPVALTITKGSIVTFLSGANGWSHIVVKKALNNEAATGKEGYVRNDLLVGEIVSASATDTRNTAAQEKPKAEPKPAAKPIATPPPAQTQTRTTPTTPTQTRTTTTPPTTTTTTTSTTNTPDVKRGKDEVRLSANVDLRAGPGANYRLISQVKAGTIVSVLFASNGWSQVTVNGAGATVAEGYINNEVLK